MDYKTEQLQELEVLESIYPEELTKISDTELSISISPEDVDKSNKDAIPNLHLHVLFPETYPDAVPILSIKQASDEDDSEATMWYRAASKGKEEVLRIPTHIMENFIVSLNTLAQESVGMAMIFTLASQLREDLTQYTSENARKVEQIEEQKRNQEIAKEQEKFKGTKVTPESFMIWKVKFDADMAARKDSDQAASAQIGSKSSKKDDKIKLTGKQLFEEDKTLAASDTKLLEEGDVTIDTSLFERELIIDSDEDEDEVEYHDSN